MLDPDANMQGSYPTGTSPGNLAAIRHWALGNIPGRDVINGFTGADAAQGTTVLTPFLAPAPPSGSHRYCFLLFEQTGGFISFAPLGGTNSSAAVADGLGDTVYDARSNWDYAAFVAKYGPGTPVARNYQITMSTVGDVYSRYP